MTREAEDLIDIHRKRKAQNRRSSVIDVLGHPTFYPRFGFHRASSLAVKCEWDVPDEVVMLLILDEAKMRGVSGLVKYRHEFSSVS